MKRIVAVALIAAAMPLSACVVRVREPAYAYSEVAPPVAQTEIIGVAPSADHFWVGGHWYWAGGRYVWRPGYWELRRPGHAWVSGHWDRHPNRGHYWVEGRWR